MKSIPASASCIAAVVYAYRKQGGLASIGIAADTGPEPAQTDSAWDKGKSRTGTRPPREASTVWGV